MSVLKKGSPVIVNDPGLIMLYQTMKRFDPKCKPNNRGWVEEICDDGMIMVKFQIGDDDPDEHSQVAPYPENMVMLSNWEQKPSQTPQSPQGPYPSNKPAATMQTIHIYTSSQLAKITELASKGCSMAYIAQEIGVSKSSFIRDYNNPALEVKEAYDSGLNEAVSNNITLLEGHTGGKQGVKAIQALRGDLLAAKIQNTMDEIDYFRENEEL